MLIIRTNMKYETEGERERERKREQTSGAHTFANTIFSISSLSPEF